MSSAVQVTDNTPLLFKALAWDNYYRTQFPDSPDERPEFNSMIYDKSSAEFKALLFDAAKAHRNEWRDKIASNSTFNDEMAGHNENGTPT